MKNKSDNLTREQPEDDQNAAGQTDDASEPGSPKLDGFIDRIVFADKCGYVYKLDPGVDSYWIPRKPPGPPPDSLTNQF